MSRPREHDERTATALLEAAERIVGEEGLDALSVRRVARETGTTTRAIYSLFGSKDGLVSALGTQAFQLLRDAVGSLPTTDDPVRDLVEAGVVVFRRFTLGHPALWSISFLRDGVPSEIARTFCTAQEEALAGLHARIGRLADAGRLGMRSIREAAVEFDALCGGLAAHEQRGYISPAEAEQIWRDALGALVRGWDNKSPPHGR